MSSTILFNKLYPYLAAFAEGGTYTRTRRGKREIVRKGRRKKDGALALRTSTGALGTGLLAREALRVKAANELQRGKAGMVFKTLMSRGGGLKLMAIPAIAGAAGGYATYRYYKKRGDKT